MRLEVAASHCDGILGIEQAALRPPEDVVHRRGGPLSTPFGWCLVAVRFPLATLDLLLATKRSLIKLEGAASLMLILLKDVIYKTRCGL
jgi:hypothetical protein